MPLPAGTQTTTLTLVANVASSAQFVDRYGYMNLINTGTAVAYARADGQAATVAGNNCIVIPVGGSALIANGEPLWFQSQGVIPAGSIMYGGGNTTGDDVPNPAIPGRIQDQRALNGQQANPGTLVSVISAAITTITIEANG